MSDKPKNDPQDQATAEPSKDDDAAVDDALSSAQDSLSELQAAVDASDARNAAATVGSLGRIELLNDVELHVMIELGRTEMLVEDVLKLGEGSVVELDKLAGDPVDVYVNHRLVARGEVLVLNDNFCIRISEILADLGEQAEAASDQLETTAA